MNHSGSSNFSRNLDPAVFKTTILRLDLTRGVTGPNGTGLTCVEGFAANQSPSPQRGETLAADAQLQQDSFVPFGTNVLQVRQKPAPFGDHNQQPSAGRMIFLMRFEVLSELRDALTQDCDLYFWRAGIGLVSPIVGNNLLLMFGRQCHL